MRRYVTVCIAALLVVACVWGILSVVMRQYAKRQLSVIENQYHLKIRYQTAFPKGFDGIRVNGLTIVHDNYSGVELYARTCFIESDILKSSFSKEDIKGFEINDLHIRLTKGTKHAGKAPDYASTIEQVYEGLASLFSSLPPYVSIHDIHVSFHDGDSDQAAAGYYIPYLLISGNRFMAEMQNEGDEMPGKWICRGSYQEKPSKLSLRLYAGEDGQVTLPFLEKQLKATVQFDTLAIELQKTLTNDNIQVIRGKAGVKGLTVHQASLSSEPVFFGKGFAGFRLFVGENFFELDSSATNIQYNKLQFHPYLRVEKNGAWRVRAAVDKNDFPADDLFASLPADLFRNLNGMQVAGMLSYHFLFDVDMAEVDDLVFESEARTRNFKILAYGKTDLRKMETPFTHTVYDNGKKVRSFEVGSENPNFYALRSMPRYLPTVVMHGEDYAFYRHKGFFPEAFHRSLVENINTRKFARGASTLSMQVVKNVFLNQDKTMARKLEEILIVWLIENNHLASKARMLEVYLNIIEWGPNIYGITEASRFYFIKEPPALTLSECIFLTYIIPSPKHIRDNFNGLRPKRPYYDFFDDAVKRLRRRGIISSWEASRAHPDVNLRGAVVRHLQTK